MGKSRIQDFVNCYYFPAIESVDQIMYEIAMLAVAAALVLKLPDKIRCYKTFADDSYYQ